MDHAPLIQIYFNINYFCSLPYFSFKSLLRSYFVLRALARILKLPVIFERVPVKKAAAAGETEVEHAVVCEPSRVGSRGPPSRGNAPVGGSRG